MFVCCADNWSIWLRLQASTDDFSVQQTKKSSSSKKTNFFLLQSYKKGPIFGCVCVCLFVCSFVALDTHFWEKKVAQKGWLALWLHLEHNLWVTKSKQANERTKKKVAEKCCCCCWLKSGTTTRNMNICLAVKACCCLCSLKREASEKKEKKREREKKLTDAG